MRRLIAILTDQPVESIDDAFRRNEAVSALAKLGTAARAAVPALLRTLVVPVSVDCAVLLRVATAEALWKVDMRFDVALPFLAWALKDEYWGASLTAVQVLSEMGTMADQAVPDLIQLAERRSTHGPFSFERFAHEDATGTSPEPLLAVVANALGRCGPGRYWRDAHGMLTRLTASEDAAVRAAATKALEQLGPRPYWER